MPRRGGVASPADARALVLGVAGSRSAAVCLVGPVGIGKSFHFDELVSVASAARFRTLAAWPSATEAELPWSGLRDLGAPVSDEELAALPPDASSALRAALVREVGNSATDVGASGAFRVLVERLAHRSPVLIAIDDVRWLDVRTRAVVDDLIANLPARNVAVLLTCKHDLDGAPCCPPSVRTITVPPLPDAELESVVSDALGRPLPGLVMRRTLKLSQGNPWFAIELARTLLADPGATAALPESLAPIFSPAIRALPARAQQALAAAAALRLPTTKELTRLRLAKHLAPAQAAGLITVRAKAITFRHPLDAAAAYAELTSTERRHMHLRLADVVSEPAERAAHLAFGSSTPDAAVAAALDSARERALRGDAFDEAVWAARLAVRASPPDDERLLDRRIALAELLHRAGAAAEARDVLAPAVATSTSAADRARALMHLARIDGDTRHLVEALELSPDDAELAAAIRLDLSALVADMGERVRLVDEACATLTTGDSPLHGVALGRRAAARLAVGRGFDARSRPPAAATSSEGSGSLLDAAEIEHAWLLCHIDEPLAAAELLIALEERALARVDEPALVAIYRLRSQVEFGAGNWDEAARLARRSVHLADRGSLQRGAAHSRLWLAWVLAHRGVDEPTDLSMEAGELALGALRATLSGDAGAGVPAAQRVLELADTNSWRDPSMFWFQPYAVETLVAAAHYDDAAAALTRFEDNAQRVQRQSALAVAARCRAALLASTGDLDGSLDAVDDALRRLDDLNLPFERARALLIRGTARRRLKRKAHARTDLEAALTAFDECGARPFADLARDELDRMGSRHRR